ncbi:MAG: ATP-binding protein, partial [Anaerolineales bacterium]
WGILTLGNLYTLIAPAADASVIIPPLERAAVALVTLWLSWAFLAAESPRHERDSRTATIALTAVLLFGYSATIVLWNDAAPTARFNQHSLGLAWTLIPLLIAVPAAVLVFVRYQDAADIPLKVLFWGILAGGHAFTLYRMLTENLSGDLAGTVRVTMLAAMALVPVIIYRLVIERFRTAIDEVSGPVMTIPPERLASAPPPTAAGQEAMSLLRALGIMLEDPQPAAIPQNILRAVARTLKADLVAIAAVDDPHWADPIATYDSVRDHSPPGLAINLNTQPTLASAIELNMQMVLLPNRNSEELGDLNHRLDVQYEGPYGPAYVQPLARDRQVIGVLVIANVYSGRLLTDAERKMLEGLGPIAARLLAISRAAPALPPPVEVDENTQALRQDMQAEVETQQNQVEALSAEVDALQAELTHAREKLSALAEASSSDMSITQQIRVLNEQRAQLSTEREALQSALAEAQTILATATADTDTDVYRRLAERLDTEKQKLLAERAELARELNDLKGRLAAPTAETFSEAVESLRAERDRIAAQHEQLKADVQAAQQQIKDLGLEEGIVGIGQLLAHLTEERNRFLAESKRALAERDKLMRDLNTLDAYRIQEEARTRQIDQLQHDLRRLTSDREALIRQRDALRTERDALNAQREDWFVARVRLTEQYEDLRRQFASGAPPTSAPTDPDLEARLDAVEEHRSDLEWELLAARRQIAKLERALADADTRAPAVSADDRATAETLVGLAQELRTPLTSIKGYTDLLLGESMGILGENQRQFLLRVQVNVEYLMQLIENLVRVLAIDYGSLLLSPRQVDPVDLIDDAITASSAQYREKGLNLALDVALEMPLINADADAMQQVLTRLLANAYLASPADAAVSVCAYPIDDYALASGPAEVVYFGITDQGGGVAPEDQPRVFNRHYRAENPLISGLGDKGTGLAIAKALVDAHGGHIWLESEPGTSTTFHVVIPVAHQFGEQDVMRANVSRLIELFGKSEE